MIMPQLKKYLLLIQQKKSQRFTEKNTKKKSEVVKVAAFIFIFQPAPTVDTAPPRHHSSTLPAIIFDK